MFLPGSAVSAVPATTSATTRPRHLAEPLLVNGKRADPEYRHLTGINAAAARCLPFRIAEEATVARLVDALKTAPLIRRKAKDILRASRLPLLPKDNFHVAKDLAKVKDGRKLSPVLLVRGHTHADLRADDGLVIADGYHRVCASYHLDEDTDIPCKLV